MRTAIDFHIRGVLSGKKQQTDASDVFLSGNKPSIGTKLFGDQLERLPLL
jgi:hypothetical protein